MAKIQLSQILHDMAVDLVKHSPEDSHLDFFNIPLHTDAIYVTQLLGEFDSGAGEHDKSLVVVMDKERHVVRMDHGKAMVESYGNVPEAKIITKLVRRYCEVRPAPQLFA